MAGTSQEYTLDSFVPIITLLIEQRDPRELRPQQVGSVGCDCPRTNDTVQIVNIEITFKTVKLPSCFPKLILLYSIKMTEIKPSSQIVYLVN
jgi:hypothetical protein